MMMDPTVLVLLEQSADGLSTLQRAAPGASFRFGPLSARPGVHGEGGVRVDPGLLRGVDVALLEEPPTNFGDFDRLAWMQITTAGYAQVLDLPVLDRGIKVTNALGVFDVAIAEWNVMAMLMCHRHMPEMAANQRGHLWDPAARFQQELRGSVLGLWGYGGIARETARLAKAMGLEVWSLTREATLRQREEIYRVPATGDPEGTLPDRRFALSERAAFLAGIDFLCICVPLTRVTLGMVGEDELRLLKPTAVLINPARAPIVQLPALTRCLQEGWIKAAAFDVHYAYPLPPDHPIWDLPNLILTPHISGGSAAATFLPRIYDLFSRNLVRFLEGRSLLNQLTEVQLRGD